MMVSFVNHFHHKFVEETCLSPREKKKVQNDTVCDMRITAANPPLNTDVARKKSDFKSNSRLFYSFLSQQTL